MSTRKKKLTIAWLCQLACISALIFFVSGLTLQADNTAQPVEKRLLTKKLFVDKAGNLTLSGGILRLPRQYAQGERGEVIIEGEEPTRFVAADANNFMKTFGQDDKASTGHYIAFLQKGFYDIEIAKPAKLRLWYRASFPTVGNWCHTEVLDNNKERSICDNNTQNPDDPSLNRWVWKKGEVYEFSAGGHTFSLDWQGGDKLDQMAFLPEGQEPKEAEVFTPTFGKIDDTGSALSLPLRLRAGHRLERLSLPGAGAGGRVVASFSDDRGKTWKAIPDPADLGGLALTGEKELVLRFELCAATNHTSPVIMPDSAIVLAGDSPVNAAIKNNVPPEMLFKETEVTLFPASWAGLRPDGQDWVFVKAVRPDDKGVIWLDAAAADHLEFSSSQESWIQEDAGACSGKAVYQGYLNRNLLSFDIHVPATMRYCPWFRVKLFRPAVEINNVGNLYAGMISPYYPALTYQLDRGAEILVNYENMKKEFPLASFQKQEWIWVPGKPFSLRAGTHVLRLRKGLDYMLIDRIALAGPEALGPEGKGGFSPKTIVTEGEMLFHGMDMAILNDPAGVKAEGQLTDSVVAYEYSTDQGKTFAPFSKESLVKEQNPRKEIVLKAKIQAGKSAGQVRLARFTVRHPNEILPDLMLSNPEQKIIFDRRTGMPSGWWTQKAGWILSQGSPQACFGFQVGNDDSGFKTIMQSEAELTDVKTEISQGTQTLIFTYALAEDTIKVIMHIALPPQGLAKWNLSLENNSRNDIKNIQFPLFKGLRPGYDPENISSVHMGYVQTGQPKSAEYIGQPNTPGAPISMLEQKPSESSRFDYHVYPGCYSMGWISCYGDVGGFTAQVRNQDGVGTFIGLEPNSDAIALDVTFNRLTTISSGQKGECSYEVGFHEGDWHRAADFYSQWAHSWMDFTTYVNRNWAKYADAQVFGWHYISAFMATRFVTHLIPESEWLGASGWMHYSTAIGFTIPMIDPRFGTLEEFRKAHAESAKRGIYHLYYLDVLGYIDYARKDIFGEYVGELPRSKLPSEYRMPPAGFGVKWGTKDSADALMTWGWSAPTPATVLCVATKAVRDYTVESIANNYVSLTGGDGVYADESHAFRQCNNALHDHGKQHGLFRKGMQECFKVTLDQARKINPNTVIISEGFPDQLLQYADFGINGSPQMLYTFPEVKLLMAICGVGSQEEGIRARHIYSRYYSMESCMAANNRNFFAHRKRIKDWMYESRFMDDVGLAVSRPGIVAKWFERNNAEHAGALINIHNELMLENAVLTLRAPRLKDARFALAYLFDEEEVIALPCRSETGLINITVPKAKASSILIPTRFPEKKAMRTHLVWPQAPGENRLVLFMANMTSKSKDVLLAYTLPPGVTLKDAPAIAQIPAWDVKKLDIPMTGLERLSKMNNVTVEVKDKAGTILAANSVIIAPPLYNGGFETDSVGKGTPDGWRTFGHMWYTHLLPNPEIPFDLNQADGTMDPQNPAEGKYSLRLNGKVPLRNYWNGWRYRWTITQRKESEKAPIENWCFNTGHSLILKPSASYKVSFKFRKFSDEGTIEVNNMPYGYTFAAPLIIFPPQKMTGQKGSRDWQTHEFQFAMPKNRSETLLSFVNDSPGPVWIDDVKISEVK